QFLRRDKSLITLDSDGTLRTWDTATTSRIGHDLQVKGLAVDSSGSFVAAWSDRGDLHFWHLLDQMTSPLIIQQHQIIKRAQWAPKSGYLLTVSDGNSVQVWDGRTQKPLTPPLKHDTEITGASFNPEENAVLTWCLDGTVRLWSIFGGAQIGATMRHSEVVP